MNDRATPQDAAERCAERVNEEIQRTLRESPGLRKRYEELTGLQKKIDQRRSKGEKVPLDWIGNPFYQTYYLKMGWAEAKPMGDGS